MSESCNQFKKKDRESNHEAGEIGMWVGRTIRPYGTMDLAGSFCLSSEQGFEPGRRGGTAHLVFHVAGALSQIRHPETRHWRLVLVVIIEWKQKSCRGIIILGQVVSGKCLDSQVILL